MEAKGNSENQIANLEMVLESISEDLAASAQANAKLYDLSENLNEKIDILVSSKNDPHVQHDDSINEIKSGLNKISEFISKSAFFIDKLQKLSEAIERNNHKEKMPLENEVIHRHHISKGFWVAMALLIIVSLESAGWLNTVNKSDLYTENDTKYRFMRMDTAAGDLQNYLDSVDAWYKSNPNMRKRVIELEDRYHDNIDRLEKAARLKQAAKDLENKVHMK